jgi:enoyl reductase-like protein
MAQQASQQIITDLSLQTQQDFISTRGIMTYTADLYRYIDLMSEQPLTQISIYVWFSNSLGQIFPLQINERSVLQMKLLFQKK